MTPEIARGVALRFLGLAALHHLVLTVLAGVYWGHRRGMTRAIDAYLAAAFATTALALATERRLLPWALVAAAVAALFVIDTVRPRNAFVFARTPRVRLVVMAGLGLFGFAYPGYSGEYPILVFSPLGVLLPPTLLVALALENTAWPESNRVLHWTVAVAGLVVAVPGLFVEGWIHAPLLAASLYAVPLLLGRGRTLEPPGGSEGGTVQELRDRMYSRWTLLPGPRDPRRRGRRRDRR